MQEFATFHNIAHIFISLLGAITVLSIYRNIRSRFRSVLEESQDYNGIDKGLFFIALGLLVWVVAGAWSLSLQIFFTVDSISYSAGHSLWSILNSMFFLFAIMYFDEAPIAVRNSPKKIIYLAATTLLLSFVFLGLSHSGSLSIRPIEISIVPDFLLSVLVSILLATTLHKTFQKRELPIVASISTLCVLLILVSQIPELVPSLTSTFTQLVIKLIAKTSLIFVFLVLATTWVIRLAHTPRLDEITLAITDWSRIKLSIPSKGIKATTIDFGSKTVQFKNLVKLAVRRKYGQGREQSMEVGGFGEIKSQTYLTRIIENVNEMLSSNEIEKIERGDLLTFLGEGRYRLRVLPQHIHFEPAFLEEFVDGLEHDDYRTFVTDYQDYK